MSIPDDIQTFATDDRRLRIALREETRASHEALDRAMIPFAMDDKEGYRAFLGVHGSILPAIERAMEKNGIAQDLPDWSARTRREALARDLEELGAGSEPAIGEDQMPDLSTKAARFGAAYVLEGSRLGAKMLLRQVPDNGRHFPTNFLRHGESSRLWPAFVSMLDEADSLGISHAVAISAARHIFGIYERAAKARISAGNFVTVHE